MSNVQLRQLCTVAASLDYRLRLLCVVLSHDVPLVARLQVLASALPD